MARETALVNGVKEIVVILGEHTIGVDHKLLTRCVHLYLCLLPVSFGHREPLAFVSLDLVDDVVLAVEVDTEADTVLPDPANADLSIPPANPEEIKNAVLVGRPRRRVLIAEIALGDPQFNVPPLGEGIGLPISHHYRGIGGTQPPGAGFIVNHNFFSASSR